MITRRRLLSGLVASGAVAALPAPLVAGDPGGNHDNARLLISAARRRDGSFVLLGCTEDGAIPFEIPLPGRGHATVIAPDGRRAVHVARRPGRFMLVVDLAQGVLMEMAGAPEGRHFYGHACFSADGRLLFTTENDYENGRGVIGVWSLEDGCRRVAERESHDIGPHDLTLMPGGDVIAIANGGILTHPQSGRTKLNIPEMRPSLAFVDAHDGTLLRRVTLPPSLQRNSIRHLAAGPDGSVLFAMQYQGPDTDTPPLVGLVAPDGSYSLFDPPEAVPGARGARLRGYCADVAIDASGRFGAATFPRGNRVAIWSIPDGRLVAFEAIRDSAGVTAGPHPGAFHFSTGFGRLVTRTAAPRIPVAGSDGKPASGGDGKPASGGGGRMRRFAALAFDNHIVSTKHVVRALRRP